MERRVDYNRLKRKQGVGEGKCHVARMSTSGCPVLSPTDHVCCASFVLQRPCSLLNDHIWKIKKVFNTELMDSTLQK